MEVEPISREIVAMSEWLKINDELVKELPFKTAEWLLEYGSLTERLETEFGSVCVNIIEEGNSSLSDYDKQFFHSKKRESFVRKVILSADDRPLIFAKTIVSGKIQAIEQLGNKPLGKILFSNKLLQRSRFRVRKIDKKDPLITANNLPLEETGLKYLWARQSLWVNKNEDMELLLYEVFLPGLGVYK